MKYLLNGVAIAAALVIAGPTWAQAPATSGAPSAAAPAAPMAPQRHKRVPHMAGHRSGGSTADQLNGQELARIQGGGAPPPSPQPMGGVPGQPNIERGIPGAGQPSPSLR
jgi:hypothetical protein